jgi:hypothetical protein
MNRFNVKEGKWTRMWWQIETNTETSGFEGVATLSGNISDVATSFAVSGNFVGAFENGLSPFKPGRRLQVGTEMMTVVTTDYTGTTTRNLTVTRGTDGTSAASHTAGDTVSLSHDYISAWVADEDNAPVQLYDRMPYYFGQRQIRNFWLELNTSIERILPVKATAGFPTLTGYFRDFIALRKTGAPDPDWEATLLTQPTAGGN